MRKLLVFQHVPFEPLGTLDGQFRASGFRIRYVNFSRLTDTCPDVRRYHGLVVLGGPMSANEFDRYPHLTAEIDAIRQAVDAGIPVLGICLGAQLIATALGGRIRQNPVKEIGWFKVTPTAAGGEDALFSNFNGDEMIFQWHGDTFDLPEGACELARSATGAPQAFRYGTNVYALQFHLEVDAAMIERWLDVPENRKAIAATGGAIDPDRIRREIPQYIERLEFLSERCFAGFIGLFGTLRRRSRQPH